MLETKIKEAAVQGEKFPALYSNDDRSVIICVISKTQDTLTGVVLHSKNIKSSFGAYSVNWAMDKYKRMPEGSELTIKFIQE